MNKAIYILSIVDAIFLPLGFLSGVLGINVGGIAGAGHPLAFAIVSVILAVLAIVLILNLNGKHGFWRRYEFAVGQGVLRKWGSCVNQQNIVRYNPQADWKAL